MSRSTELCDLQGAFTVSERESDFTLRNSFVYSEDILRYLCTFEALSLSVSLLLGVNVSYGRNFK